MINRNAIMQGIVAGILALITSFSIRLFIGGGFVPEIATQTFFSVIPGSIEAVAVGTLGVFAKYLTFVGAIIFCLIVYGIIGQVLSKYNLREGYYIKAIQYSIIGYASFLPIAIIFLLITRLITQPISNILLAYSLILPNIIYGFTLSFLSERTTLRDSFIAKTAKVSKRISLNRRKFIRIGIISAITLYTYYGLSRLFKRRDSQPEIPKNISGSIFESEVTPNELFFKVDINVLPSNIDINQWRLEVTGLVNNDLELSYEELTSMPVIEKYSTLECISNSLGGSSISTALWKGVLLKTVLDQAQINPEAVFIIFRCHDGYDVGIPLDRGPHNDVILAYEMNGVRLPDDHGYPIRAITPGIYGMMNPKWITRIELVNAQYKGYWQRGGWSNTAEYRAQSIIVNPGNSQVRRRFIKFQSQVTKVIIGEPVLISGYAFTGGKGVSKVEVSVDGGSTWEVAKIKEPLSEDTWTLWSLEWIPLIKGEHKIMVKAENASGTPQIDVKYSAYPNGATGHHVITVEGVEP
ncbi:Protein-methionine-sulfoxide reductase catalytic subunit MsrP [subsurface metagenome]